MRAISCLALLAGLTACTAGKHPQPAAQAVRATLASTPRARYSVEGFGLSAEFPSPPLAGENSAVKDKVRSAQLAIDDGPTRLELRAVTVSGRDRPKDEDWLAQLRARFAQTKLRDVELDGFRGMEVRAEHDGRRAHERWWVAGDGVYVASASTAGGPIYEALAGRFFDSVRFAPPFRIYAWPATRFSVKVPAHGVEINTSKGVTEWRESGQCFYLGGVAERCYCVSAAEMQPTAYDPSQPDLLLDRGVQGIAAEGFEIVWQGPLAFNAARGREVLGRGKRRVVKARLIPTDHFLYVLTVLATVNEAVLDDDAAQFFASLVWY